MKRLSDCKIICFVALFFMVHFSNGVALSQNETVSANEKREAEKVWESLIKAKGGREKLHSITNMLTEYSKVVTRLDIFPNSLWNFAYQLDGKPVVNIWDGTKSIGLYGGENGLIGTNPDDTQLTILNDRVPYLLETKWNKLVPQRVTRIKQDKKNFDVIETIFEKMRIDFVFEPEEMLVREVQFYDQGKLWQQYNLSNYVDVDGIKMPQSRAYGWSLDKFDGLKHPVPIKFTFNVEYDPQLFERPLKATTPDAWKPQKPANQIKSQP